MLSGHRTRVLIVDDSAIVRKILTDALAEEPDLEVVGTAPDPYVARDKILSLHPDVLTLDIEMPRMDGLTFLKKLMHFHPLPAIVISSLAQPSCRAAVEALELGAVEVLAKPGGPYSVGELRHSLAAKIRAAAASRVQRPQPAPAGEHSAVEAASPASVLPSGTVIAIGASTGGIEAIASVLTRMPRTSPGILIAQHIPPGFSRAFANRLNEICALEVKEAENGDALESGRALVAPGDQHMLLRSTATGYFVIVKNGPRVCYQRPSVDVLFLSVAEAAGGRAIGVLLTGMGSDGSQGLLKMRQAGARTMVQNEATCVVFGMPREAVQLGAAEQVLGLPAIPGAILASELRAAPSHKTA
jgi:two-component system chemotaxis response regulator CheB